MSYPTTTIANSVPTIQQDIVASSKQLADPINLDIAARPEGLDFPAADAIQH